MKISQRSRAQILRIRKPRPDSATRKVRKVALFVCMYVCMYLCAYVCKYVLTIKVNCCRHVLYILALHCLSM